jgi:hypothetical protein
MKHARVPVTVSLPSNLAESFLDLQRYGVKKARKKSILTEADVEKLVFRGR